MSCPICGQKPMNCDCTTGDKKAHQLEEENTDLAAELARLREENEKLVIETGAIRKQMYRDKEQAEERGALSMLEFLKLGPESPAYFMQLWREGRGKK